MNTSDSTSEYNLFESKRKSEDRIFIEQGNIEGVYENIKIFEKEERKDQFLLAMSIGFAKNKMKKIKSNQTLFLSTYLQPEDEALINAVALHYASNNAGSSPYEDPAEVLAKKPIVYTIAEQYANYGIQVLKDDEDSSQIGNYLKIFEKEIIEIYNKRKDSEISEFDSYVDGGESSTVEFKSSMRWDVNKKTVNKELQKVIAKTISGFLNSEGGILLIGVTDQGSICGIERDIETLNRKDIDGFEQNLIQIIQNYLGTIFISYLNIKFVEKEGKIACMIKVNPSPEPVYLKAKDTKEFYIRAGNTTRPLDMEETMKHIKIHW